MNIVTYVTRNPTKFQNAQNLALISSNPTLKFTKSKATLSKRSHATKLAKLSKFYKSHYSSTTPGITPPPTLGGLPGPHMKFINEWFTPQDFLNLMQGKVGRTISFENS